MVNKRCSHMVCVKTINTIVVLQFFEFMKSFVVSLHKLLLKSSKGSSYTSESGSGLRKWQSQFVFIARVCRWIDTIRTPFYWKSTAHQWPGDNVLQLYQYKHECENNPILCVLTAERVRIEAAAFARDPHTMRIFFDDNRA